MRALLPLLLALALGACSVQQTRTTPDAVSSASQPVHRESTVALLGATGFVGGYLLQDALSQGYPLRVLSRSPEKLAYLGDRVTVIEGDAADPATLRKLLQGADMVISAIGPPRAQGDSRSGLNSAVTAALLPLMEDIGIDRYLVVSGAAVVMPGDQRDFRGWWMRQLVRLRYPGILEDRQREHKLLLDSGVSWTLLRCPLIESGPIKAPARVSNATPQGFYLRATELARFAMEQLESDTFVRRGPFLSSN